MDSRKHLSRGVKGPFGDLRVAHVDMDAFFASIEEMVRPALKDHPLAVGGDPGSRHGVVSTANYRAREFGIHSGMSIGESIRRCPELIRVPTDPQKYIYFSLEVLRVMEKYTPAIEPASVDEAFLDLRGLERRWPDPREFAERLQADLMNTVGVGASIGIGPTKMIAKIASGMNKPAGITVLTLEGYRSIVGELSIRELWGVGPQSEKALRRLGFEKVRDLARADPGMLQEKFGVFGLWIQASARGELDDRVVPYYESTPAKSYGHETTLFENVSDAREVRRIVRNLSAKVARRVRKKKCAGRTITLKVRFPDFETPIRSLTLPLAVDDGREIARSATFLLERIPFRGRTVRLLGVSLSGIEAGDPGSQEAIWEDQARRRRLLQIVDRIQDRWGEEVVTQNPT